MSLESRISKIEKQTASQDSTCEDDGLAEITLEQLMEILPEMMPEIIGRLFEIKELADRECPPLSQKSKEKIAQEWRELLGDPEINMMALKVWDEGDCVGKNVKRAYPEVPQQIRRLVRVKLETEQGTPSELNHTD